MCRQTEVAVVVGVSWKQRNELGTIAGIKVAGGVRWVHLEGLGRNL